jgi:hypothetical protein
MFQILTLSLLLLFPNASRAATVHVCGTYDSYNKYLVADVTSLASVQNRAVKLCVSRKGGRAASCRAKLFCQTSRNARVMRMQKVVPFPPELRGPRIPSRPDRAPRPRPEPSYPSTPAPEPERNKNAGGSCRANSDCYSQQFCAGGQCFEKSGNGSQSCKVNNDCYSNDFCVSGQCFPRTGNRGGSCKVNNDCYSYQFCVSGECFEK